MTTPAQDTQRAEGARLVTVCDKCLQASCWHGEFMCEEATTAGTVEKAVAELEELNIEDPHHWVEVPDVSMSSHPQGASR